MNYLFPVFSLPSPSPDPHPVWDLCGGTGGPSVPLGGRPWGQGVEILTDQRSSHPRSRNPISVLLSLEWR